MLEKLLHSSSLVAKFGPVWMVDSIRNRSNRWNWNSADNFDDLSGNSSLSDGTKYVAVCRAAVEDDKVYSKYKSCSDYREILEHVDFPLGLNYLRLLQNIEVSDSLKLIARSDGGSPAKFHYPNLGRISPTHLRYAKVTQDLKYLFGNLDNFTINEIGVGFGGQALHILNIYAVKKYNLLDLEWPAKLALKNLLKFNRELADTVKVAELDREIASDLLVSNYAFSELSRGVQDLYFRNIVSKAARGYIIYNFIHDEGANSLTAREFLELLPDDAEALEENPLTHPGNVLIVWGHKRDLPENLFTRTSI